MPRLTYKVFNNTADAWNARRVGNGIKGLCSPPKKKRKKKEEMSEGSSQFESVVHMSSINALDCFNKKYFEYISFDSYPNIPLQRPSIHINKLTHDFSAGSYTSTVPSSHLP